MRTVDFTLMPSPHSLAACLLAIGGNCQDSAIGSIEVAMSLGAEVWLLHPMNELRGGSAHNLSMIVKVSKKFGGDNTMATVREVERRCA